MFRKFIQIFLVSLLLLQTGCLTKMLWDDSYEETFKYFLISENGKYVVMIGRNYHYVLDDELGVIQELLNWDDRNLIKINIDKTHFVVDKNNSVKGYVMIDTVYNNINTQQEAFLLSLGFKQDDLKYMSFKIKLKGARYVPRTDNFEKIAKHLSRTYIIPVHNQQSFGKRVGEAALTPVTIVADSILLFGKVLLMPFEL